MRLSDSTIERFAWQQRALCAPHRAADDPEIFFPDGHPVDRARGLCKGDAAAGRDECPVRLECLRFALETGAVGMWGGTSTAERRAAGTRLLSAAG
jgi:hypothetical protein